MNGKRLFDASIAGIGIVLLAPLLAAIAILVRFKLGTPVLFRQRRPGLNGRPFTLIKFRTMSNAVDASGNPLADELRLTRFGRCLRKSSLDELPELYNVLVGEMSLVGPRPLLMRYIPFLSPTERRRFSVRPGITGWAQINGRNSASWDARLEADVWYVERRCFLLDLRILLRTMFIVLTREGAIADTRSAMLDLDEERRAREAGA